MSTPGSFGHALDLMESGKCARRTCWNSGTFITLVPGSTITVSEGRPLAAVLPVGTKVEYQSHIDMVMRDASGEVVMFPWQPTSGDQMVKDWVEHTL